jgi:membrane-associated protein
VELLATFLDFFLHLDRHLTELVQEYGVWTYGILFLIVFCETGLVVTPFLPGDSLLFASGSLAALGGMDPILLSVLLIVAAVLGDMVNYWAGHFFGMRIFKPGARILKREYLDRTHDFYERYGAKTIVIARFVPIVRTFAPFVAGMGSMQYRRFFFYNVTGAVLWVVICVGAGYAFGNIPVVKENFSLVILGIIAVSILPIAVEFLKGWRARARGSSSMRRACVSSDAASVSSPRPAASSSAWSGMRCQRKYERREAIS